MRIDLGRGVAGLAAGAQEQLPKLLRAGCRALPSRVVVVDASASCGWLWSCGWGFSTTCARHGMIMGAFDA